MVLNSLVQAGTLRLGPVVLVGVVLRRPSRVRREAVVDELPREVGTRRGASRGEEARAGVARRRSPFVTRAMTNFALGSPFFSNSVSRA